MTNTYTLNSIWTIHGLRRSLFGILVLLGFLLPQLSFAEEKCIIWEPTPPGVTETDGLSELLKALVLLPFVAEESCNRSSSSDLKTTVAEPGNSADSSEPH